MFDSAILEVAAALVLVFLLLSLICSEIGNKVSEWLNWRARDLEIGVRDSILQGNQDLLAALYYDPLITSSLRRIRDSSASSVGFRPAGNCIPVRSRTIFRPGRLR